MLCSALCQELSSASKGHEENALKRDLAIHGLAKMVGQKDKEVLGSCVCSVKLTMFSSQNYRKVMEYIFHGSKNQVESIFFTYFGSISLKRMRRFDLLTTDLDHALVVCNDTADSAVCVCNVCGRICRSAIGLYSHQRTHRT